MKTLPIIGACLATGAAISLTSCTPGEIQRFIDGEAIAEPIGLTLDQPYPHRDHSYDGYLKEEPGLSQWQLNKLFLHVAMPQSRSAMYQLLGYPKAEAGDYAYWSIEGGSSELAVQFRGDKAVSYTVGY